MSPASSKVVEITQPNSPKALAEMSARDFSPQYRVRVLQRFLVHGSKKRTARDFSLPARLVSDILDYVRVEDSIPMPGISGRNFLSVRDTRRTA